MGRGRAYIPSSIPANHNLLAWKRRRDKPKSNDDCLKHYSIEDFYVIMSHRLPQVLYLLARFLGVGRNYNDLSAATAQRNATKPNAMNSIYQYTGMVMILARRRGLISGAGPIVGVGVARRSIPPTRFDYLQPVLGLRTPVRSVF
jgi:hypothetical protein